MPKKKKSYLPLTAETPKANEHYTRIHDSLLESDAFRSLTPQAQLVYLLIKSEYKGDYTGNRLKVPMRQMERHRLSRKTVVKAIKDLEDRGFIEVVEHGGLPKIPNTYKLSANWYMKKNRS